MNSEDITVGIYSKSEILIHKLKSKFEIKEIKVLSSDNILNLDLNKLNYLIIDLIDNNKDLNNIVNNVKNLTCKILVLHSLSVRSSEKYVSELNISNLLSLNLNLGVLLTPEILGEDIQFNPNYLSHDIINQSILSERIKISSDNILINMVSLNSLCNEVVRQVFSFGITGHKLALIGQRKIAKTIIKSYLKVSEDKIVYKKNNSDLVVIESDLSIKIDFSLSLAVQKTIKSFNENLNIITVEKKSKTKIKGNKIFGFLKSILGLALLILILPLILIITSTCLLLLSFKLVTIDSNLSKILTNNSMFLSKITANNNLNINFYYKSADFVYKISSISHEALMVVDNERQLFEGILGNEGYNSQAITNSISASLDKIYNEFGFIEEDINALKIKKIDTGELKNKLYLLRNFSSRLESLIGVDKPKKYLVLFQNNMELRPTGGFIGSLAIISFDKGKLTEIVVSDVYSIDGQLKGHVEPPEPIKKYLGEAGWYLRDSNWDPDFNISAKRAEWFLNKEVGTQVDGVISIDLKFVKDLLDLNGPIELTDFNKTVNSDNLYRITQDEVEKDFFAGSIKKQSFLTALSKALISKTENIESSKYLTFLKLIYKNLENRHIQIYLDDINANKALLNLGYGGVINTNTNCGKRCVNDNYSLIDANLGVNKSNLYIERKQNISVQVSRTGINHELIVNYKNQSGKASGQNGIYKNYARLIVPKESSVLGIREYTSDRDFNDLKYDVYEDDSKKEIGFYFELLPDSQKIIQIAWNLDNLELIDGGEYRINIRKQAGTKEDNLSVNLNSSELSLTGREVGVYNTTLASDFHKVLYFK